MIFLYSPENLKILDCDPGNANGNHPLFLNGRVNGDKGNVDWIENGLHGLFPVLGRYNDTKGENGDFLKE